MWQPGMSLEDIEKIAILKAFDFFRGNKTQTANSLGIAIRTLDSKLEKYGAIKKYDVSPQANLQEAQAAGERIRPETGIHVEPREEVPAQREVSVRKRQKV